MALNTALQEEAKLRALLEHVHENPNKDCNVPKRHKHLTSVLKSVHRGKFQSWTLMPADVDVPSDDEGKSRK